jgi:hypothetical protein
MSRFYIYGALPPLEFGSVPDISSKALNELFELNLSKSDLAKVSVLKLWIDIMNIYGLFRNQSFDSRGNYSKSTIKALIANEEDLPSYVFDFFQSYDKEEDRKKYFPKLIASYFSEEKKENSGFLHKFLSFEQDMRVLLAGFRAKKLGVDLAKELQFADLDDPIVSTVLMQKDRSGDFQFPVEYSDLEDSIREAGDDPSLQYDAVARYRFNYYNKNFTESVFSLEGVLAYMQALWVLEDYFALKKEEGEKFLSKIVEKENVS